MREWRQRAAGEPAALAGADLVQATLDQNDDETEAVCAQAQSSASGDDEQCTRRSGECDYRNWFRALDRLQVAADHHGNAGMAASKSPGRNRANGVLDARDRPLAARH